jgi:hypothetical protein
MNCVRIRACGTLAILCQTTPGKVVGPNRTAPRTDVDFLEIRHCWSEYIHEKTLLARRVVCILVCPRRALISSLSYLVKAYSIVYGWISNPV